MSEEENEGPGFELDPRVAVGLLGLVVAPSVILALLLWAVFQRVGAFRRFHQPVSNVATLTLPPAFLSGAWAGWGLYNAGLGGLIDLSVLIPLWACLGLLGGYWLVWSGARKLKREPWLSGDRKHWASRYDPAPPYSLSRKRKRTVQQLRVGALYDDERAPLGLDDAAGEAVFRYYEEANTHTLITGASGSGKSVTMRNLIYNDLLAKVPVFVVDFKRDVELAEKLAGWCKEFDLSFTHFIDTPKNEYRVKNNPAGPSFYDPLAGLSADAKADMLLNLRKWDTAANLYKSHMSAALTLIFNVLEEVEPYFTDPKVSKMNLDKLGNLKRFETIVQDPARLTELLTVLPPSSLKYAEFADFVQAVNAKANNDQKNAYTQLRVQIRNILQSGYGRWLAADVRNPGLDLYKLSATPGVVLFSISGDDAADFAQAFGSVILQHMTNISGHRQAHRVSDSYLSIYVDEFAVLNPVTVKGLLQRGRSAKVCVTLALQSFQQVVSAAEQAGEALLKGYIDTVQNFIIHSGINYDTAENMANIFGKEWKTAYDISHSSDSGWLANNKSSRQQQNIRQSDREVWVLDPTDLTKIKGPRRGAGIDPDGAPEAFFITKNTSETKAGGGRAVKFRAVMPEEISLNEIDSTYVLDVGPPAGEYNRTLLEEATKPMIDAAIEQGRAEGLTRTFDPTVAETGLPPIEQEALPEYRLGLPPVESIPETPDESYTEEDIDLACESVMALILADPSPVNAKQRVQNILADYKDYPRVRAAALEAGAIKRGHLPPQQKKAPKSFNRFEESADSPPPGRGEVPKPKGLPRPEPKPADPPGLPDVDLGW